MRIALDDQPVTQITSPKILGLLAYLVSQPNRTHSRESLSELLWSGQATGRQNLRQSLSRVQSALPQPAGDVPFFQAGRQTIGFNSNASYTLDLAVFDQALATVRRHPHPDPATCPDCCAQLTQIVHLYRGDFLDGLLVESLPFDEWMLINRERLRRQSIWALEVLTRHHAQEERFSVAYDYAQRQIAIDPLHEEAYRQAMTILAQNDRTSQALELYAQFVDRLRLELDVAPAQETTDLYQRIRAAPITISPLYPFTPSPPHNLPPQFTPFVGREEELRQMQSRLDQPECRLLTLVGPGGVGKSRLAVQAAQARRLDYADGVWFVPLAALAAPEQVLDAVASALDLRFDTKTVTTAARRNALLHMLGTRRMLLVLDNFEHLLPHTQPDLAGDAVELVLDLLQGTRHIDLLITSRQPLGLRAEWIFDVTGLTCPPLSSPLADPAAAAQYSAVQLFVQVAQRLRPSFVLDPATVAPVQEICVLTGGIPLALEMAAATVRTRTPAQIAQEIRASLDTLATSMRDVPPRHRSLRAVFEDSWRLLRPAEQTHFRRLSVFPASFSAAAAGSVAELSGETLTSLVERSLLQRRTGPAQEERFALHETLRHFAAERLAANPDEAQTLRERHCRHYTTFLAQQQERLESGDAVQAAAVIQLEMENVYAAWSWAAAQVDLDALARGTHALLRHYVLTNRVEEGERAFAQAVAGVQARLATQPDAHPVQVAILADLLAAHARMIFKLARYAEAATVAARAVALADRVGAQRPAALASLYGGIALLYQSRYAQAQAHFERALTLARALSWRKLESDALRSLGILYDEQGDLRRADHYYTASLEISRQIQDLRGASASLGNLGVIQQRRGEYGLARAHLEESLAVHEEIGDGSSAGRTLTYLGNLARDQGDWPAAQTYLLRACQVLQSVRDRHHEADALLDLARVHRHFVWQAEAIHCLERAILLYREIGDQAGEEEAVGLLEELG